jgi:exodeoxyribonuclease VII small subunit
MMDEFECAASLKSNPPPSFEECLAGLESTVRQLEDGQVTLAESLQKYEQGVGFLQHCYRWLEEAERRVELLTGFDAQGNPVSERFEEAVMSLEEKAQVRSRRRTQPTTGRTARPDADNTDLDESETLF